MHNFRNLDVWKSSMELVTDILKATVTFPDSERYGIINQMNRSAISIPSNIAEGSSKSSNKYFINFLETSLGSAFELETQLIISHKMKYLSDEDFSRFEGTVQTIQKQVTNFIQYLQNHP